MCYYCLLCVFQVKVDTMKSQTITITVHPTKGAIRLKAPLPRAVLLPLPGGTEVSSRIPPSVLQIEGGTVVLRPGRSTWCA